MRGRGPNGNGFSAEEQCLLLLARGRLPPEVEDNARSLLGQGLSWPHILKQARAHGVFPLLGRNLERLGFPGVPAEVRTELAAADRLNAARNILFRRGLIDVLKRFGEAGVPVIPLKGVALAHSLYGDVTLRVCSDIDILVPRHAVAQASGLLLADGYEGGEEDHVDPDDMDALLRSNIEYPFVRRGESFPYLLELHWDIAWRWRTDTKATDDLWAEVHRKAFWGVEAYALSPEWQLLYLAVHAARHRFQALKWLVDLHEVCSKDNLDWDKVTEKATRFGWEEVLKVTLSVCHALFGTTLPARFTLRALPRWLSLFPASPAPPKAWDEALFATRLFRGPLGKLRYLTRLLFVPTLREHRLVRLPAPLAPLYYPLRPVRLGGRWSREWVRAGFERLRASGRESSG